MKNRIIVIVTGPGWYYAPIATFNRILNKY